MQNLIGLACLGICLATGVTAQDVLVSNPVMCGMIQRGEDVRETGMVLESTGMYEIEYFCEFDREISFDWSRDSTKAVVGYCAEPGFISPTVFAVQMNPYEPGIVQVWTQGRDEPTRFEACNTR
jgi:hypothetical protein